MKRNLQKDFDYRLLLLAVIICLIGLILLYSASYQRSLVSGVSFMVRQMIWVVIGLSALLIIANINYRKLIEISYILYAINLLFLVLVLFLGEIRLGAQRWLQLGNFAFQPSELAKVVIILVLAKYLGERDSRHQQHRQIKKILVSLGIVAVPLILILKQPDLGTAIVFLPILFCMLYVWGARLKYLLGLTGVGLVCSPFLWHFLRDYQRQRLLVLR